MSKVYLLTYAEFLAIMVDELEMSNYQKKYLKHMKNFVETFIDPSKTGSKNIRVELCHSGKYKRWSYWITFGCLENPGWFYDRVPETYRGDRYVKTLWCKRKEFPNRRDVDYEQLHTDLEVIELRTDYVNLDYQ